ncbi:MAG: hypothetical protein HRU41_39685 [Saprospiraceae bacterium]|nr:hypothetical protein [Saprospiraceae bacterium]
MLSTDNHQLPVEVNRPYFYRPLTMDFQPLRGVIQPKSHEPGPLNEF